MLTENALNNLLRYVYSETSEEENAKIEEELFNDFELSEAFSELEMTKNELEDTLESPSDDVVNRIIEFSKFTDNEIRLEKKL